MKRIRIGKDFAVKWSIYSKTENGRKPYALDPENSLLRLVTPIGKEEVNGFIVEDNMLTWVFRGKAQKLIGVYALELVERNGANGMITIDTCKAFELVAHSCEESDNETGDIVIDSLVFESEVTLAPLGYGGAVEVDDQMSDVSENPVQNKVVKAYIDDIASSKQNTISDIEQIRSGAAAGKTAVQPNNLKTINGQTILGNGNLEIEVEVDTTSLATKEELETLKNEVIDNEEVVAAALNDVRNYVDEQIAEIGGEGGGGSIDEAIIESNERVTAAALNDLNYRIKGLPNRSEVHGMLKSKANVLASDFETKLNNAIADIETLHDGDINTITTSVTNLTNEVISDEKVIVYALDELRLKIEELNNRITALEGA